MSRAAALFAAFATGLATCATWAVAVRAQEAPAQAGLGFMQLRGTTPPTPGAPDGAAGEGAADGAAETPVAGAGAAPEAAAGQREASPIRQNLRLGPQPSVDATAALDDVEGVLNTPRARHDDEVDAFAAAGVRVGTFLMYPSMEMALALGGNTGTLGPSPSVALSPEVLFVSDWSRHEVRFGARGTLQAFTRPGAGFRPSLAFDGALRLDVRHDWQADLAAAYEVRTLSATDAAYPVGADAPPLVATTRASAALERTEGPLTLRLGLSSERTVYGDTTVSGVPVDLGDRNGTVTTGDIRIGYDGNAALQPFIAASLGLRGFDRHFDGAGFVQAGTFAALRGGIAFDLGPTLTGEAAIGVRREEHDDPALPPLEGLTFDGRAVWSPERLTTITVTAATTFNPTATPTSAGSITFEGALVAERRSRHDLTLGADGRFRVERFADTGRSDLAVTLGAQMTWMVTRQVFLTTRYSHDWVVSQTPGRSTSYDTIEARIRMQR